MRETVSDMFSSDIACSFDVDCRSTTRRWDEGKGEGEKTVLSLFNIYSLTSKLDRDLSFECQ